MPCSPPARVSETTPRRYLDLLTDRQLQPRLADVRKRQVKAPRIYVRDSGLLHQLLGMRIALDDLQLENVTVIYPGTKRFPIAPSVEAEPLHDVWQNDI